MHPNSPVEEAFRRYLVAETKLRLHQPVFASQVMLAYETRCAVCALGHRELLDAAHIIPDRDPRGAPVVPNGLALSKIHHHAASGFRADVYLWRNPVRRTERDGAQRLKDLERESLMLKRLLANAKLEKAALKEIARGNF